MRTAIRWLSAAFVVVFIGAVAIVFQARAHPTVRNTLVQAVLHAQVALNRPSAATLELARTRAQRDDWTTFAHDQARTGLESQDTGITRDTVGHLALRWIRKLGKKTVASPIVARGSVYLATYDGDVIALDSADGSERWRRNVGATGVRMTPALVGDLLLVGVYGELGPTKRPQGASFAALDAASGALRWQTALPGLVRSEPVVVGSTIYEGLAGGDAFSGCFNGRIVALDLTTGRQLPPVWYTVRAKNDGGGIWGPLSSDGSRVYIGTGNSCSQLGKADYGDGIVALGAPDLHLAWHVPAFVPNVDDSDVGGGVMLLGTRAYVAGKSGYLYVIDRTTGTLVKRFDLNPYARNGGSIGTPTGDGRIVVVSTGYLTNPWDPPKTVETAGGDLVAYDLDFHERYRVHMDYTVMGYAAFVPGVGFTAQDRRLIAFDSETGTVLWSALLDDTAYASPAVVPSGLYEVTNSGTVFAYGMP
jgi:outer membrane protein assembly factor BamB